jgi:prevent-host-death family protein
MTILMVMSKRARVIAAGEFKAKCLELMDVVAASGGVVVITKRGKPVAQLVPVDDARPPLLGLMKGHLEITGDIMSPVVSAP